MDNYGSFNEVLKKVKKDFFIGNPVGHDRDTKKIKIETNLDIGLLKQKLSEYGVIVKIDTLGNNEVSIRLMDTDDSLVFGKLIPIQQLLGKRDCEPSTELSDIECPVCREKGGLVILRGKNGYCKSCRQTMPPENIKELAIYEENGMIPIPTVS